jgi:hypothetical protein
MKIELSKLEYEQLMEYSKCLLTEEWVKDPKRARILEIEFIYDFIDDFETKSLSEKWVFDDQEKCKKAENTKIGDFQDEYGNKFKEIKKFKNTNTKFPNFIQTIFTAGDREQFDQYAINKLKGTPDIKKIWNTFDYLFNVLKKGTFVQIYDNKINIFLPFNNANYTQEWGDLLQVQSRKTISPKKGSGGDSFEVGYKPGETIRNELNKLQNNAVGKASLDAKLELINNMYIKHNKTGKPSLSAIYSYEMFSRRPVIEDPNKWYANNCIFRNNYRTDLLDGNKRSGIDEYGGPAGTIDEGDKTVSNYLELLSVTCLYKTVKDCCFFMNPRDFPLLTVDSSGRLKHPYNAIFEPNNTVPYIKPSMNISNLLPIFSQSIRVKDGKMIHSDKLFPDEDMIREMLPSYTLPGCVEIKQPKSYKLWKDKKYSKALFRGSLTGCGTEISNPRAQICSISKFFEKAYPGLIDAKITDLKQRFKKDPLKEFLDVNNLEQKFKPETFKAKPVSDEEIKKFNSKLDGCKPVKLKELGSSYNKKTKKWNKVFIDDVEQMNYKYIIVVEGFVSAYRLTRQLGWGSLILFIDTEWKMWFEMYDKQCNKNPIKFEYYEQVKKIVGEEKNIAELTVKLKDIHGIRVGTVKKTVDIKSNISVSKKAENVPIINAYQLKNTIKWCGRRDDVCKIIAENGRKYYLENLNRNKLTDYVSCALNSIE